MTLHLLHKWIYEDKGVPMTRKCKVCGLSQKRYEVPDMYFSHFNFGGSPEYITFTKLTEWREYYEP